MSELAASYAPLTLPTFGIDDALVQSPVDGCAIASFGQSARYLDIDLGTRRERAKRALP